MMDFANQRKSSTTTVSSQSSRCCSATLVWQTHGAPSHPVFSDGQTEQTQDFGGYAVGIQSSYDPTSHFYEELFCSNQTSASLVPLAGALMISSVAQSDVVKEGYLRKLDQNNRRYFVLRAGSHTGPSRLEWYKSQEKFTAVEKSVRKTALFGSRKQGVIYLRCCLGVSRIGGSRKGHTVALYAKDQNLVLLMEDQQEQESWYVAIRTLMEEEQEEEHGDDVDDEDDGYCTLPPAGFFKEVWPVTVKPRCLGSSKSLKGENWLCLTATSLILVKVGAGSDLPSVTIPLLSVRRFGHLEDLFYLELGRSAPNGPGEIWMEARDQALAQHIHKAVREGVQVLRVLPDFSGSPTSTNGHPQAFIASKRCRPKCRDKLVNVKQLSPLFPRQPDIQMSPAKSNLNPLRPNQSMPESSQSISCLSLSRPQQSFESETGGYMEMKVDHSNAAATEMQSWEPDEVVEGPGYMIMSPLVSPSSPQLVHGGYMTMASAQKWDQSASSSASFQTECSSSAPDGSSPLQLSHHWTTEQHQPLGQVTETPVSQSEMRIAYSSQPQSDARQEEHNQHSVQTPSHPVERISGGGLKASYVTFGQGCSGPLQAGLKAGTGPPAVPEQSAVRCWLSSFLSACLQAEDRI